MWKQEEPTGLSLDYLRAEFGDIGTWDNPEDRDLIAALDLFGDFPGMTPKLLQEGLELENFTRDDLEQIKPYLERALASHKSSHAEHLLEAIKVVLEG